MKIAIILGKGVEGCGVTRCAIEFKKYYKNLEVFGTIDKKWSRSNNLEYTPITLGDDAAYQPLVDHLNTFDVVMFYSIPSKKHPENCIKNFVRLLDDVKVKKVAVHHDHSYKTLHDNSSIEIYFRKVDLIITHSANGALSDWMRKSEINTPLVEMGLVGYGFDDTRAKYWKPIEETRGNVIRWIGRTAQWKGPTDLIDFHNLELRKRGFITILEGLEASMQYAIILYHDGHGLQKPRILRDHFRAKNPFVHGEEKIDEPAYCYPQFNNSDMLERMSKSGFGSNLYHLKASMYGKNIENCHAECVAAGTVPLFHYHFGQNVHHRKTGNLFIQDKNTGTVWVNDDGPLLDSLAKCADLMLTLSKDPVMRDEWRHMAFEYWKAQANNDIIIRTILDTVKNTQKPAPKVVTSLGNFFS